MKRTRLLVPFLLLTVVAPAAHAQAGAGTPMPSLDLGPMAGGVVKSKSRGGRRVSTITTGSSSAARIIAASFPASRRAAAEQAFEQILATYPQVEQALGARSGDAAVATAVMLIASYEAYRDADIDQEGVTKVIGLVRGVLETSPGFARATTAKRRLFYEEMAILGLFVAAAKANLDEHPDAATQQSLRAATRSYLGLLVGGDPDRVEISSAGLVMRQEPSVDDASGAPEVAAAPSGRKLDNRIHCAVNVNLGRSYDALSESFEEKYERWLLFEDGRVYDDLPPGPLTDFDAAAARRKRPRGWGTWKIKGGALEVVWDGSKDRRPRLYRDWFRLDVPRKGARLSGVYSKSGFVQQSGAGTSFSASGWSTMVFDGSGRFSYAKGGSTSYSSGSGSVDANDKSESEGTYAIDGPNLVMKHRDGTVFRASLFFVGKDAKIIFVNGSQYLRHQG